MKSINIKLLLPDTAYNLILERSKVEGVDPAHYCSSLITESVGNDALKTRLSQPFETRTLSGNGIGETRSKLPDTVEQIFAICRYVWKDKIEFADSVRKVAKELDVRETTVRDKCTRRISLPQAPINTDQFLELLTRPGALRDYLCHRFPKFSREIAQRFGTITPEALR